MKQQFNKDMQKARVNVIKHKFKIPETTESSGDVINEDNLIEEDENVVYANFMRKIDYDMTSDEEDLDSINKLEYKVYLKDKLEFPVIKRLMKLNKCQAKYWLKQHLNQRLDERLKNEKNQIYEIINKQKIVKNKPVVFLHMILKDYLDL